MATTKTEFFAWLRKTEGPWTFRGGWPFLGKVSWRVACLSRDTFIDLSSHRTVGAAVEAGAKYRRWLAEFEETENTKGARDES